MTRDLSDQDLADLCALVDGALEPAARAALEARIAAQPDLAEARDLLQAGRDAARAAPRPGVSPSLRARIEAIAPTGDRVEPVRAPRRLAGLRAIAASVAVTAVLSSTGTWMILSPGADTTDALIAAAHRRSLLAASPVDVASADRHTVKPWLDGRIGLSPPAPDLAAAGFPLVGGRVDVVSGRTVPTLVYRHNEHLVSVFAVPVAKGERQPRASGRDGYNMVEWRSSGFDFTAVSDLEADELAAFVARYRASPGSPGSQ